MPILCHNKFAGIETGKQICGKFWIVCLSLSCQNLFKAKSYIFILSLSHLKQLSGNQ